ncbi:glycosyltransferase [Serratia silvae]|uniref:Glycosyltransferase n=1 Tax=Serratia silvae TaxID=2824122 RepID=A0ABT0KHA5_9GAMM|nr:glycosyltransferase [Serratia silvae]MCL1031418.1 glycosyltransferase [Serratia silvae]
MNNEVTDKVSIYLSTCNRVDRLKRALTSVLNQDYSNIEILVCDDASSDGTQEYMEGVISTDSRIKYLRNESNKGACFTRNQGIFSATGKYITGIDDDDEFTSNRISLFVNNWDEKYSFLCCDFRNRYIGGEENIHYNFNSKLVYNFTDLLFDNPASNQIFTLTSRMLEIGGFDDRAKRLQDWDTWLRLSYNYGDFIRLSDTTYIMHHDHSLNETRVSKSCSFLNALNDLVDRNKEIYGDKNYRIVKYSILYQRKELSIIDGLKWAILEKNAKHFIKFFVQFVNEKRTD